MNPSPATASLATVLCFSCLLFLSGCDIAIQGQETQAIYHPETDTMDLLLIYRGVHSPKETEDAVQNALDVVERIASGRREFMLLDSLFHTDLDDPDTYKDLPADEAAVLGSITLSAADAFLDPEGRFCAYQVLHVPRFSDLLASWNGRISEAMLKEAALSNELSNEEFVDARTRELLTAYALSGRPWVSLRDGSIEVYFPMTRATAERFRRDLFKKIVDQRFNDDGSLAFFGQLLLQMQSFEIGDEHIRAVIGDTCGLTLRFLEGYGDSEYPPALLEALRARGWRPEEGLSLEEVRRLVGAL